MEAIVMMYTYGGGAGWFVMALMMVLVWGAIITAVILVIRGGGRQPVPSRPHDVSEHVLAERFARGEIDEEEFHQRLGVLQGRS
jgi:putative membrane protein